MDCAIKCKGLPPLIKLKALEVFKKIDVNNSGSIDIDEAQKFMINNCLNKNTLELFNAYIINKIGQITEQEWIAFLEIVKKTVDLDDEVIYKQLQDMLGVQHSKIFKKSFKQELKKELIRKQFQVQQIVQANSKRKSNLQKYQHHK